MKKNNIIIQILTVTAACLLFSCQSDNEKDLKNYFISLDQTKINFKDFKLVDNGTNQNVIFKQIIEESGDKTNIEYYFMNKDSSAYLGGKETITKNTVSFLKQYIYIEGRKVVSDSIEDQTWNFFKEPEKELRIDFTDEKNKLKFQNYTNAKARFKDTLGANTLIIESISTTVFLKYGLKYKEEVGKSLRIYTKDKGLTYFDETFNGNTTKYSLIESK